MNNLGRTEETREKGLERMPEPELYASALMENANDAIFVVALDGKILNINRQAEKLLGLSWEEIEGRFYHEFVVSDDHTYAVSEVGKVMEGNSTAHNEVRLRRSDGGIVFADFSAVLIDMGNEKVMMSIGRDITEQKKIEEEKTRLSAIVESSNDAIYAIDLNGVINVWNSGAQKLFGYGPGEVLGHDIFMLVPAERHAEILKMMETCKRGQPLSHFETVRKNRRQEKVRISTNWFPIRDKSEKITGISAIVRDLREQKQEELFLSREGQ